MKRTEMLTIQQVVDVVIELEKDNWPRTAIYEYLNGEPKDLDRYFLEEAKKFTGIGGE